MSQLKLNLKAVMYFIFLSFIMLSFTVPLAEAVTFFYDDANRLIREEDSSGTIIDYIYDDGGHLIQKNVNTGGQFLLTVSKAGTGSGTVMSSETPTPSIDCGTTCSALYDPAVIVTLNVVPDAGSTFTGWSGNCSGTDNPLDVQMDKAKTCTANFDSNQLTLTVNQTGTGSGTVMSSETPTPSINCGATCSALFDPAAIVTLNAVPDTGSTFTSWSGNCSGTDNPLDVQMDNTKTCTATFTSNQFTLTVNQTGTGSGTVGGGGTYDYNTSHDITAVADTGSTFTDWSGDCSGAASPLPVLVDSDKTCTATFTLNQYTLTVNQTGTGSGTVGGGGTYDYGTTHDITAVAATGSTFDSWSGDCSGVASPLPVLVDSAKTCTATFTLIPAVAVLNDWTNIYSALPRNTSDSNLAVGSFTVGSGTQRLLLVSVVMETGKNATPTISATYGGTALSQIEITSNNQRENVWMGYLTDTQIGSGSKALEISYSDATGKVTALHVNWASYSEVNQVMPFTSSSAVNTGSTTTTFGSTIDYVNNGMTVVVAGNGGTPATGTLNVTPPFSPGTAITTDGQTSNTFTTFNHTADGSYAGTTSVDWTETTSNWSGLMVVSLQPSMPNQPPAFNPTTFSRADATVDLVYTGQTIAGAATDPEGDAITYSKVSGPAWLTVASDGSLGGIPTVIANDSFVVRATATGGTGDATLNISVVTAPVNQPPVFNPTTFSRADATVDVAYIGQTIAGAATDPEGDAITYSKVSGPAWLTVASDGSLGGTPTVAGNDSFVVRATATGGTGDATLNISVVTAPVNQPPVFNPTTFSRADATVGVPYTGQTIAGAATDPEGDAITYSKVSGPAWLTVAPDGTLGGIPTVIANDSFVVRATATGGTGDATLNISVVTAPVNEPPVADAGSDQNGVIRTNLTFDGSNSYDTDGTITDYAWDFGDGKTGTGVTITHKFTKTGTYTVTLTVTDNGGATGQDTAIVTITK